MPTYSLGRTWLLVSMKPKIAILGASLGGLIAAAELRASGFNVDIFEKGRSVGGLFSEVETPLISIEIMSFMQTNDNMNIFAIYLAPKAFICCWALR